MLMMTLIMMICDADDDNGSDQGGIHIYILLSTYCNDDANHGNDDAL